MSDKKIYPIFNTICPVCNANLASVSDLKNLTITWEKNDATSKLTKQYWHRSCLIGQVDDGLVSEANNLYHQIVDFKEEVKKVYKNRGKNKVLDWEHFLEKFENLENEAWKLRDEVVKYL